MVFIFLAYFTLYNGLQFHPSHWNWFKWILFNGWVIFHGVYVLQLPYPFICWWASRLLPCPGYDKQCCDEHWGACVSFRSVHSVHLGFLPLAAPCIVTVRMLRLLELHSFIATVKTESPVSSRAFLSSGRRAFAKSFFSRLPIASHNVIIIIIIILKTDGIYHFCSEIIRDYDTRPALGTLFKVWTINLVDVSDIDFYRHKP